MMTQQTIEKLRAMRLRGMAEAYQQQLESAEAAGLTFDERLAMLVDSHTTWRENKALARRLKTSRLETELRRRRQLPARAATGRSAVPLAAAAVAMGGAASVGSAHRSYRDRQELVGAGAGAQSLPGWVPGLLPPRGKAVPRLAAGASRRQFEPPLAGADQGGRAGGG